MAVADFIEEIIAHWALEETSGNAADSSGNGNTLTDNNSCPTATGLIGNARTTQSSGTRYLSGPNGSSLFGGAVAGISVSAWFNRAAGSDVYLGHTSSNPAFRCQLNNDGNQSFRAGNAGVWNRFTYTPPAAGSWHHLLMVYDGAQSASARVRAYVNGSELSLTHASGSVGTTLEPGNNFMLGFTGVYYNTEVDWDEVTIWAAALTGTEATELYNGGAGRDWTYISGGGGGASMGPIAAHHHRMRRR